MNLTKPGFGQNGVALALSLLLLLVLTIIGVAAMNSTMMQERMSGNIQTQTQSFEVSSEGVGRSLEYFHREFEDIIDPGGHGDSNDIICGRVHGFDDPPPVDDRIAWAWPGGDSFDTIYDNGLRLDQQMYCCRSWAEIPTESGTTWVENPSKLFVLSRGSFMDADTGNPLARREIEVRLDEADPGDPTCAFCVPGGVNSVEAGNSNALRMHGACGPAITTEDADGAGKFNDAIKDDRKDNYDGGITHGDMGPPWNDAVTLAEFVFWVKLGLADKDPGNGNFHGYWDWDDTGNSYKQGNNKYRFTGNPEFGIQSDPNDPDDYGQPRITYFDHHVEMGGNVTGHGIMIVDGQLEWGGTPDFEGLLVTLGGNFTVGGGGEGGNPRGSLVTTNLVEHHEDGLMDREPLRYPVADDGEDILVYDPDDPDAPILIDTDGNVVDNVPSRAVLQDDSGRALVHFFDGTDHRFFSYSVGNELEVIEQSGRRFKFQDAPTVWLEYGDTPRDKFGRLIPDFVWSNTWPPETYGYNPNVWGWDWELDADGNPPFEFGGSDFHWNGGGGQAFTYDCRWLQRLRHAMLCEEPIVNWTDGFPPDDYEWDDPDHSLACNHSEAEAEYNPNLDYPDSGMMNNHAWHLWVPRCDCLGVTRDADMILSGWRENLGWRDDDFAQCQGLPAP